MLGELVLVLRVHDFRARFAARIAVSETSQMTPPPFQWGAGGMTPGRRRQSSRAPAATHVAGS